MATSNPREPVIGIWAGEDKYSCPFCAFDSLQRDRVEFHIEHIHPLPPAKEPKSAKPTKGTES